MVPANSCKIPRVPHYSGAKLEIRIFAYATITLYGVLFHTFPLILAFRYVWSHDPRRASPSGLGWSVFTRRYSRNHCCFLFLQVLRWFTSPRCLHGPMYSGRDTAALPAVGFPIRTSPDHSSFAAPRGLSQLIASFIVFQRQGIHRTPLVA